MRLRLGILTGIAAEAKIAAELDSPLAEAIVGRSAADPERARREAGRLVDLGAQAILSFGLAGGLLPGLKAGDVLVAEDVAGADGEVFPTEPVWRTAVLAALRAEGIEPAVARLHASERIIANTGGKGGLAAASGAAAVDMESGAAARAAAEAGIPFMAVRAISDAADRDLPLVASVGLNPDGTIRPFAVARALIARPGEWGAVARLARETRAALQALRRVVRSGGGRGLLP